MKSYIAVCFATAAIYALVTGSQSLIYGITDAVIYGSILCLTGVMLWNTFKYALPRHHNPLYHSIFILALSLLISGCIVGMETFGIFLFLPSLLTFHVATIPVRIFITFLLIIIFRLFYMLCQPKDSETPNENVTDKTAHTTGQSIDRIVVRNGQKIKIIPINEILYIQADGDYISIHTTEGHWLKEQTMKYTEDILPSDLFIRIHRSYIVNISHISRIEKFGERQQLILHNREKIKISTARYQSLKQRLGI
ncbi:MAG: LytTR family transcriptional regulator DNA-binding domain-containing protein [Tannerella sp.]|jgi:hypothetical protein|nr:LytTR family transcriptional regulator DNA-binding domain-containing protein [Tannerella sp.]